MVDCHAHAHAHATVHISVNELIQNFTGNGTQNIIWNTNELIGDVCLFPTHVHFLFLLNMSLLHFPRKVYHSFCISISLNEIFWRIDHHKALFAPSPNSNQLSPRSNDLNASIKRKIHVLSPPKKVNNEYKPKWKCVNNLLSATPQLDTVCVYTGGYTIQWTHHTANTCTKKIWRNVCVSLCMIELICEPDNNLLANSRNVNTWAIEIYSIRIYRKLHNVI